MNRRHAFNQEVVGTVRYVRFKLGVRFRAHVPVREYRESQTRTLLEESTRSTQGVAGTQGHSLMGVFGLVHLMEVAKGPAGITSLGSVLGEEEHQVASEAHPGSMPQR